MPSSWNWSFTYLISELPEVLGMSDRVMVMHEGELMGTLDRSEATQERVMQLASGITAIH